MKKHWYKVGAEHCSYTTETLTRRQQDMHYAEFAEDEVSMSTLNVSQAY